MSVPPNLNKLRQAILGIAQPYAWWPMDADCLTVGSGLIQVASDLVARRALTFPVGARPAYITTDPLKPAARFAGAEWGTDPVGLLGGKVEAGIVAVYKQAAGHTANYQALVTQGTGAPGGAVDRWENYIDITTGTLVSRAWHVAVNAQTSTAALDTAATHVLVARVRFADGTTAVKPVRQDGANQAGTNSAGNIAAGAFVNEALMVGAWTSAVPAFFAFGDLTDLLICPYPTDATADLVQQCFKSLRGTP